jgi:hypothetical protein
MSAPNMTPAMYRSADTVVTDMILLVDEYTAELLITIESYKNLRAKLAVTNAQEMAEEKVVACAVWDSHVSTDFAGYDLMALCGMHSKLYSICGV